MASEGHAFISYVREDKVAVDRLQAVLTKAGIQVWRDTANLWAGEDWKYRIRRAITEDALAFVACFSKNSAAKAKSGQNEELVLAIEELRARNPAIPWLFSVRLDDETDVPDRDIGGGRTLRSLNWVTLSGDTWEPGEVASLVGGISRVLSRPAPAPTAVAPTPVVSLAVELKAALRDPNGDIAVRDLLMPIASKAKSAIVDPERFPSSSDVLGGPQGQAAFYLADLVEDYMVVLDPVLDALMVSCAWARAAHYRTLSKFVERVIPPAVSGPSMVALGELRAFPQVAMLYAGGLAAMAEDNYGALRAIAVEAQVHDQQDGRLPVVARSPAYLPFYRFDLFANVLAKRAAGNEVTAEVVQDWMARGGKLLTPASDYLHNVLRERFHDLLPDDDDYSDTFDRLEILLALLLLDVREQRKGDRVYISSPNFGRSTWRSRWAQTVAATPEGRMAAELESEQKSWPPLAAGLFGGDVARAQAAFEAYAPGAAEARQHRY